MKKLHNLLTLLLCLSVSPAWADEMGADLTNDLGAALPGQTYTLSQKGDYYTYTPTESSNVVIKIETSLNSEAFQWKGNTFFFLKENRLVGSGIYSQMKADAIESVEGGYEFIFTVSEGANYVIAWGDTYTGGGNRPYSFEILNVDVDTVEAEMTYCYPDPGTTFDEGLGINDITMNFNQPLKSLDAIYLSYTDKNGDVKKSYLQPGTSGYEMLTNSDGENKLVARIAYVNDIFKNAKADADYNYPFYLKIENLQCNLGAVTSANLSVGQNFVSCDENGNVSIEYQFMDAVELIKAEWPATFYNYWAPGDPSGIATLTFNGPITADFAIMSLVMGQQVRGASTGEQNDPSWDLVWSLSEDQKVLTINFTGIDYSKGGDLSSYQEVTVMMSGIKGLNGMYAVIGADAGVNIFDAYIPFKNEPCNGAAQPGTMTTIPVADPENMSAFHALQDVTVTWPGETISAVEGMVLKATVKLGNAAPQTVGITVEDNAMTILLSKATTPEYGILPNGGELPSSVITVAEGLVQNSEGLVNASLRLEYSITLQPSNYREIGDAVASAIEGENGMAGFSISWDGQPLSDADSKYSIGVYCNNSDIALPEIESISIGEDAITVMFESPMMESATISVYIPKGYVYVGEGEKAINAEQTLFLTYTAGAGNDNPGDNGDNSDDDGGVSAIYDAASAVKTIYTINGVKVSEKNLRPGVYIINGRKVIL